MPSSYSVLSSPPARRPPEFQRALQRKSLETPNGAIQYIDQMNARSSAPTVGAGKGSEIAKGESAKIIKENNEVVLGIADVRVDVPSPRDNNVNALEALVKR